MMSASGAVEPGPPGAAAALSSTPARPPTAGHLFRPISAEDEEQQPTEIESLCMNCYCNVRLGSWLRAAGGSGLDDAMWGVSHLARWAQSGTERGSREKCWEREFIDYFLPCLLVPQGMTRLLLTKIPFFREIIVSSFSCEHCGWSNTEIQSAGRIQDQGVRYALSVRGLEVRGT